MSQPAGAAQATLLLRLALAQNLREDLSINVLPWTPHEIENAAHAYELPQVHYTVVRVALGQMGIGGDDTWGARTHPEYLLPAEKDLSFSFCFRGM